MNVYEKKLIFCCLLCYRNQNRSTKTNFAVLRRGARCAANMTTDGDGSYSYGLFREYEIANLIVYDLFSVSDFLLAIFNLFKVNFDSLIQCLCNSDRKYPKISQDECLGSLQAAWDYARCIRRGDLGCKEFPS